MDLPNSFSVAVVPPPLARLDEAVTLRVGEKKFYQATCVAVGGKGVLLRGKPGSGKSDLALRLIDRGAKLVGDDCLYLEVRQKGLFASPPSAIAGKLEVRGVGIIELPHLPFAKLRLVVDLAANGDNERIPEPETAETSLCGVGLPMLSIVPGEASATLKVEQALSLFTEKNQK